MESSIERVEPHYKLGRALAKRLGLTAESMRAAFAAAGCVLLKPGLRGHTISESELEKYVAWAKARARSHAVAAAREQRSPKRAS